MIVVPSIAPSTNREASRMLRDWAGRADLVELRTDRLNPPDFGRLLGTAGPPVILTHRSVTEGGHFEGTNDEYLDVIRAAALTPAAYIDVEYARGTRLVREAIRLAGRRRIVLSYHDHRATPAGLTRLYRSMASIRPGIVKIAVSARSAADTATIFGILGAARASRQRATAVSMGEFGTHTRILQGIAGGYLSFASSGPGSATAPGQISHRELTELYRADRLDRNTKIFGLVGNPVVQSRGKYFHNAVFTGKRKNAVYVDVLVDDLGSFISSIGGMFSGLSVTMPYKNEMTRFVDASGESVRLSRSVNTVLRKRGRLIGYNTDYEAFLALLRARTTLRGKTVLVLGSGAVASTVAAAGLAAGARVTICGRNSRRAGLIAERFGAGRITPDEIEDTHADILVNATSVGMDGRSGPQWGGRIVPRRVVRNFRIICDFVCSPSGPTRLVRDATAENREVITGEDIFNTQAAMQSSHFLTLVK